MLLLDYLQLIYFFAGLVSGFVFILPISIGAGL